MISLRLNINLDEFLALSQACSNCLPGWYQRNMRKHMSLDMQLLAEYGLRTDRQMITWVERSRTRDYAYRLPISLALALHQYFQRNTLIPGSLSLLGKLDKALIDAHYEPYNYANQIVYVAEDLAADTALCGGVGRHAGDGGGSYGGGRPVLPALPTFPFSE